MALLVPLATSPLLLLLLPPLLLLLLLPPPLLLLPPLPLLLLPLLWRLGRLNLLEAPDAACSAAATILAAAAAESPACGDTWRCKGGVAWHMIEGW